MDPKEKPREPEPEEPRPNTKEESKEPETEEDVTDRLSALETEVKSIHAEISTIAQAVSSTPKKEGEETVPQHEGEPKSPDVDVKAPTEFRYVRKGRRIIKREVPVQPKKAG